MLFNLKNSSITITLKRASTFQTAQIANRHRMHIRKSLPKQLTVPKYALIPLTSLSALKLSSSRPYFPYWRQTHAAPTKIGPSREPHECTSILIYIPRNCRGEGPRTRAARIIPPRRARERARKEGGAREAAANWEGEGTRPKKRAMPSAHNYRREEAQRTAAQQPRGRIK